MATNTAPPATFVPTDLNQLDGQVVPRLYYASRIPGVKADCDIIDGTRPGGGTPTDNAALLSAVLLSATPQSPVELVLDGGFAIGTNLRCNPDPHCRIIGGTAKSGLFAMSGSNRNVLINFAPTMAAYNLAVHPTGLQGITGSRLTLENLFINANRGVFPNGVMNASLVAPAIDGTLAGPFTPDVKGPGAYYYLTTLTLVGLQYLNLLNVHIYDPTTYAINPYSCWDVRVRECTVECNPGTSSTNAGSNTAGVQTEGRCKRVWIDKCSFKFIGDDSIAFNCDEGDQQFGGADLSGVSGSDYIVSDCTFEDCLNAGRIYGGATQTDRVMWRNCQGDFRYRGIVLGDENAATNAVDGNHLVTLENCQFKLKTNDYFDNTALLSVCSNVGKLELINCKLIEPPVDAPLVRFGINSRAPHVSSFRISGCAIHRNSVHSAEAPLLKCHSGIIGALAVEDFLLTEQHDGSYADIPALCDFTGTAVGHVRFSGYLPGVATVLNFPSGSSCGKIALDDLEHASHAGSPTAFTVVNGTGSSIPISVGRYAPTNLAGIASGPVTLTGPGLAGLSVPDAQMGDGWPYRSAENAAAPAIKIGGVPMVYTLTPAAGPPPPFFEDHFTGTPGDTLTGAVPTPTQFGSILWADFTPTFPALVFQSDGTGATTPGTTNAYSKYDLTGSAANQTITWVVSSTDVTAAWFAFFRRTEASGGNYLEVDLNWSAQTVEIKKWVAGSPTFLTAKSFTLASGTSYTCVLAPSTTGGTTTLTLTVNGTPIVIDTPTFTDAVLQASAFVAFGTNSTTAGAPKLESVKFS